MPKVRLPKVTEGPHEYDQGSPGKEECRVGQVPKEGA